MKLTTLFIAIALLLMTIAEFAVEAAKSDDVKPVTGRWAIIETNKGAIKIALYEKDAPITTKNFIDLAKRKFYDGLKFHRVDPGFVIQGGDPRGNGTGGSDKKIKLEVSPKLKHNGAGVVAMARNQDPDSASSQFYITLDSAPFLDMRYAVFGRVMSGMDVIKKIEIGDIMKSVRIIPAPIPKKPPKSASLKKKSTAVH